MLTPSQSLLLQLLSDAADLGLTPDEITPHMVQQWFMRSTLKHLISMISSCLKCLSLFPYVADLYGRASLTILLCCNPLNSSGIC